jgi:excisionase family DNA binding protein
MFNQMFNKKIERVEYSCTMNCTELSHTCPTILISPTERDAILLKMHTTQNVIRTTNQKVGSSNLSGRTIFPLETPFCEAACALTVSVIPAVLPFGRPTKFRPRRFTWKPSSLDPLRKVSKWFGFFVRPVGEYVRNDSEILMEAKMTAILNTLLKTPEAAERLGLKATTLVNWRSTKKYRLRYVKVGGHVRYRESDVEEFIQSRTHNGDSSESRPRRARRTAA